MNLNALQLKIRFQDVVIRSQAISRLLDAVEKKAKNNTSLSSTASLQIPELNFLWGICTDESAAVCQLAVQGVIVLVENQCIDLNHALNKLLGMISSTCNLSPLVSGITALLIYEVEKRSSSKHYSLMHPKHPLIAVLQSRQDSWPLIIENIGQTLFNKQNVGFEAMEPAITYLLSNPNKEMSDAYSKVLLLEKFEVLIKYNRRFLVYMLQYIPFLQVMSVHEVTTASHFVIKIKDILICNNGEEDSGFFEKLLLALFFLSEQSIHVGHNPTSLLDAAKSILTFLSEKNISSMCINLCVLHLAHIMKLTAIISIIEEVISLGAFILKTARISQTTAACFMLSVITFLSEPYLMSMCSESTKSIMSHITHILESEYLCSAVEKDFKESEPQCQKASNTDAILIEAMTVSGFTMLECVKFIFKFDSSKRDFQMQWLKSINKLILNNHKDDFEIIFTLVAAIVLRCLENPAMVRMCLETLEAVIHKNDTLSTRVFPILLYKQNVVKDPESKALILEFLPKSALHKYAIPPVLSTLQLMAKHSELKPYAIHLMLQLWKSHDRCFSYLHKLLVQENKVTSSDTGVNEVLISQAEAIKEICHIEPKKHGGEFLKALSAIINESYDDASSTATCLALDGIIFLCKNEVIEIRSTWKVLSARLSKDKRILVMHKMFQLLSLIPELEVKTVEYERFMNEIVSYIWKCISSASNAPTVRNAAYKALAQFPFSCHTLKILPQSAKENLILPASMKATPFDMSKSPEDVLTYIPGYCFIDLIQSIQDNVTADGYVFFLHSLVKQEVGELPRSVYTQRKQIAKHNTEDVLSKVPSFMCTQLKSGKSPALEKNIAVGVLLSYEPPLEIGRDGQPLKRSVIAQARFYEQVLVALLEEVNIDTMDWQRCILLSSAWGAFMERAFFASEEARRVELELQGSRGHISAQEVYVQSESAWLWVRDRFVHLLKINGKDTPFYRGNSIFAVAGLVNAVNKFYNTLDDKEKVASNNNENFTPHSTFQVECTGTILCAMNPDHKPTGKVFSWLLTHLSRANSSASHLVRGCASASLCHLGSALVDVSATEKHLCNYLLQNLSHNSSVLSLYSSIGLGLFVMSLCECGYPESGMSQMRVIINVSEKVLQLYDADQNIGCLICLTMVTTAMSENGNEAFSSCIQNICNSFYDRLMNEDPSSMLFEPLSICVSAMIVGASFRNFIPLQTVENLTSWFEERHSVEPKCSGTSVSLGMLMDVLNRFGLPAISKRKDTLQNAWFETLVSEKKQTLHRIAALNGLCSLYSCGRGLVRISGGTSTRKPTLNNLLQIMFQMLSATRDSGLQSICSWEIGRLFFVNSHHDESESSLPANYSYLGEKSILKPLINFIHRNQKDDSTSNFCTMICLKAIGNQFPRPLPPLNWFSILCPFLQMSENIELMELAFKVAFYQANASVSAVAVLSLYCTPPLVSSLPENCFCFLLKNMPELITILPASALQLLLNHIIISVIKNVDGFQRYASIALEGILDSLKRLKSKQQSSAVLYDAFVLMFRYFISNPEQLEQNFLWVCDCINFLPEQCSNSLLSLSKNDISVTELIRIWCQLVKTGKKQISSLKQCIDIAKHMSIEKKEQVLFSIYDCFLPNINNEKSDVNKPDKCIAWMFDVIGWIKVMTSNLKHQLAVDEVFLFLVDVCFAVMLGCAGLEITYSFWPGHNLGHQALMEKMPHAIAHLLTKNTWTTAADKIIDWLVFLLQSQYLKESDKYNIKLALCSIRHLNEFKNDAVWTVVASHMINIDL